MASIKKGERTTADDSSSTTAKNQADYRSYTYDDLNQLTRENNKTSNKTSIFSYDGLGNILSKKEYTYTTGTVGTVKKTVNYRFDAPNDYPVCYDLDVYGRMVAMSKTQTVRGKHFLTSAIEYEEYTEEELRPYFDKAFEERILPPVHRGKKYILDNLGKLYYLTLRKEEVMRKLQS